MDYEMESAEGDPRRDISDPSVDIEWQVDSEWINLSTPTTKLTHGKVRGEIPQSFHFIPTSQGRKFLVVDHQLLKLSQKSLAGHSYWVCSVPSCSTRCVLDPEEKHILRYAGEHNHDADVSRSEYKNFINALNTGVKENPHVKPKTIYDAEVERSRESWKTSKIDDENEAQPNVPSFDTVRTAMYNTRNAVLSSLSLKPAGEDSLDCQEKEKLQSSPSKSRSRDTRAKRKSTPAKSMTVSATDLDELEEAWSIEPHKDANLSDFEEWLADDVNANISPEKTVSHQIITTLPPSNQVPEEDHIIMPLLISPKKGGRVQSGTSPAMPAATKETVDTPEPTPEHDETDMWTTGPDGVLRRKYRKRPGSSSVFTCPHCPYKSNRHFNVQRHERLAHSMKKPEFSCKECGTSYSLEYRLKLHIKAVHQGQGHHCHICNRTFETMTGLKSHVVTKHKNEDPAKAPRQPPPELTCPLCGRVFSTKAHLQKHTASHVMVQPYRCFMCNRAFMEETAWLNHQNSCREPFTIQCCLCSKVLVTPQELLLHMDRAHGRAEYSCNCGKSFPWKKSLLTHQQKCSLFMAERTTLIPPTAKLEISANA